MKSPGEVKPPYIWVVRAYDRDWRAARFVERLIEIAVAAGLMSGVDAMTVGDDHRDSPPPAAAVDLAAVLWAQNGPADLNAAGVSPAPWWLGTSFFRESDGGSIGRLTLRFSGDFSRREACDGLWQAFRTVDGGADATCAFIDVRDRWLDLRDEGPPLVSQGTLESVLWANFIDAETMRRFRRDALDLSAASRGEWTPEGGLYLRLSEILDPGAGARDDVETRRHALIDAFRAARAG